jgi:hypothetical protein
MAARTAADTGAEVAAAAAGHVPAVIEDGGGREETNLRRGCVGVTRDDDARPRRHTAAAYEVDWKAVRSGHQLSSLVRQTHNKARLVFKIIGRSRDLAPKFRITATYSTRLIATLLITTL